MKKAIFITAIILTVVGAFAQSTPIHKNRTLKELFKKMESFEVDSAGNLTRNGKPVTKAWLKDSVTVIRLSAICRDVVSDYMADIIPNTEIGFLEKINETNEYGDQIPHFVIKPPVDLMRWYIPASK